MTAAKERFKRAVVELIAAGTYPGATAVNAALGHHRDRADFNGREEKWRAEVFEAAGWVQRPNGTRSWVRPHALILEPPGAPACVVGAPDSPAPGLKAVAQRRRYPTHREKWMYGDRVQDRATLQETLSAVQVVPSKRVLLWPWACSGLRGRASSGG